MFVTFRGQQLFHVEDEITGQRRKLEYFVWFVAYKSIRYIYFSRTATACQRSLRDEANVCVLFCVCV